MSCCNGNTNQSQRENARPVTGQTFRPAVDIVETPDAVLVHADVPGARPETVDIHVEDSVLRLRAGVQARERAGARVLAREYGVGEFQRDFRLGPGVDVNAISADLKDGVLTLRLPKSQAAKARTIKVVAS